MFQFAKNLNKWIDFWSESNTDLMDQIEQEDCQEQVVKEYKAGLTHLGDQHMTPEMRADEILSLSLMDVHSKMDVGKVVVNSNIFLLNDVCFQVDDRMEVNLCKMDCQMWMIGCQNSNFHMFPILWLQVGFRRMHYKVQCDQNSLFSNQISRCRSELSKNVEEKIPPGSEILHKGVEHVDDTPFSSKLMSDQFKHEKRILEDFLIVKVDLYLTLQRAKWLKFAILKVEDSLSIANPLVDHVEVLNWI